MKLPDTFLAVQPVIQAKVQSDLPDNKYLKVD